MEMRAKNFTPNCIRHGIRTNYKTILYNYTVPKHPALNVVRGTGDSISADQLR